MKAQNKKRKNYNENIIINLANIVLKDGFNDAFQNKDIYDGQVSSGALLFDFFNRNHNPSGRILDLGCGCGDLFSLLPKIKYGVEPNSRRRGIARKNHKGKIIYEGWCENTPFPKDWFSTIISWGTFCFVRSPMETLCEINRILIIGGRFIFDVGVGTNLPIIQTVEPNSFVRWVQLFGFMLVERRRVEEQPSQHRFALAFEKTGEFDYRRFLMPQCEGKINNFLPERDWYLR